MVGIWLVGLATSLPELVTSLAAVRMRAYDLAVGNLFGSNAFNMLMFLPLDLVHRGGPILGVVGEVHALAALVSVVLMAFALAAIVYRAGGRVKMLEPSGLLMLLAYLLGLALIFSQAGIR
jgi:cation:H+ antiporter